MCRENGNAAIGNFIDLFDEHHAFSTQVFDHPAVMHDLMAHIDRRAVKLERFLDNFNSAVNAGAEESAASNTESGWALCIRLSRP